MIYRLLLFIVLVVSACPAWSAEKPAALKDVVAALEKGYTSLRDVQADFNQKTVIPSVKREQLGSGEVLLKRPSPSTSMFRFNYTKPRQEIISDGKQVWFYLPENKQVMVSTVATMFQGSNSIALSYLTGLGSVSRDFNISFAKEPRDAAGNYHLDLIPKSPSPVLSRLSLTVSAEAVQRFAAEGTVKNIFPIVASIIYDAGGNETRIDYSRARVNKGIDNSRFNFKIPKGVEVIKP